MSESDTTSPDSRTATHTESSARQFSRRRFVTAASAVTGTAVAGCIGAGSSSSGLTVGFPLPLTGTYAVLGKSIINGFELRMSQLDGEIDGMEVETVQLDTEADPSRAPTVTRDLLLEENVDVLVGPVSSAVAMAMLDPVQQEDSAVWLNANAGDYRLVKEGCIRHHYRTAFNDWQTSAPLAEWVYENLGETAYLAYADYAFGQNSADFFAEAFKEAGGTIDGETAAPLGTDDYSPYLGDISDSDAEIVFSFFSGSDAVNYISQFHEFGLDENKTQVGSGFLLAADVLPGQGEAALDKYSLLHYTRTSEDDRNQEFLSNYRDEYDGDPNVFACQGYDAGQALEKAVNGAGSANMNDLIGELDGMELDSPRGSFKFNPETGDPIHGMDVRKVVEGDDGPENEVVETLGQVEGPSWGCSR